MSRNPEKQARTEEILGELAELGLMLARDVAVSAREAEDPGQKAALAAAFQKTARTVRLTLALDAKLERQAAQDAREIAREDRAEAEAAQRRERLQSPRDAAVPDPAEHQKRRVRSLMSRLLWTESERDHEEYEILTDDLEARLDEAARDPGFADLPIEVVIQRLADDMRLSGEFVLTTADPPPAGQATRPPSADTG
ncbi:MAG: hypothetical protein ACXWKR_05310 [Phenylobacterium sp.]